MTASAPLGPAAAADLNTSILRAIAALENGFIFRKLGVCYDYVTTPGEFPRRTLPNAQEARDSLPNAAGLGTGLADCSKLGALLFDGYLLRLENGLGSPDEERVFDRLIGGLIRTGTTAPKGYLVRGLTADGRGFYRATDADTHVFWAFALWRAYRTAAIALESQTKLENIAGKWLGRLERDGFDVPGVEGKPGYAGEMSAPDARQGPKLLAVLAVGADLTNDPHWREVLKQKLAENDRARLAEPAPGMPPAEMLATQLAWTLLAQQEEFVGAETVELARSRQRTLARLARPHCGAFRNLPAETLAEAPDLDWRAQREALRLPEPGAAFVLPPAWSRLERERETYQAALEAALTVLLAGERELAAEIAEDAGECLRLGPWENLWLGGAIAPAISVHARGVELGLWDAKLLDRAETQEKLRISVAPYLEPDFDERFPERAGHVEPPAARREEAPTKGGERGSGGRGERGERGGERPSRPDNAPAKAAQPGNESGAAKDDGGRRSGGRRRRRRRR